MNVATQLTARSILREVERTLMPCREIDYAHDSVARHRVAREIVAALTQQSPGDVSRLVDSPIGELIREAAIAAAARHAAGEPLAYAVGSAAFRNLVLHVDKRVLIPRPETEIVVEEALKAVALTPGGIAVDIGTGSGAIALSLATEGRFDRVIATDISADALAVAAENVNCVPATAVPVEFLLGADFEPLAGIKARVLVSNPPYIAFEEAAGLPASVRDWEPSLALFAEHGGMARYEALLAGAALHLEPGGWLVLEVDSQRAHETALLAQQDGRYGNIRVLPDLTRRDRVLVMQLPAEPHEAPQD